MYEKKIYNDRRAGCFGRQPVEVRTRVRVEELYCGSSTNIPHPCKEEESELGTASTCVVITRPFDLLTGPTSGIASCGLCFTPLLHLEQTPEPRPCRLISPVSYTPSLSTPGGLSCPFASSLGCDILSTTDPPGPPTGDQKMIHPLERIQWTLPLYQIPPSYSYRFHSNVGEQ